MPKTKSIQNRLVKGTSLPRYQRTHHVRFAVDEKSLTIFLESLYKTNPKLFSFSKEIALLKLRIDATLEPGSAKSPPITIDFKPLSGRSTAPLHAAYGRYLAPFGKATSQRSDAFFAGAEDNNVRVQLSRVRFDFYNTKTGAKIDTMVVQLDVFGVVYVSNELVKINALYLDLEILERPKDASRLNVVKNDLNDCFEELLEYIINALVDDRVMDRIKQLSLPELDLLIDDKIKAEIADIAVQDDALILSANVTCSSSVLTNATARTDLPILKPDTESASRPKEVRRDTAKRTSLRLKAFSNSGNIGVAITELALNVLGDCLTPMSKEWKDGGVYKKVFGWKYEAKLDILSAVIDIKPAKSILSGHLQFRGKVCGRVKPFPWVCIGLSPPKASYKAEITPKVSADGKTVRLFVDLDYNSLDFDWGSGWPWPIDKFIDWLLDRIVNLILAILDIFTGEFEFDVLSLPKDWPGTQVPWNAVVTRIRTDHSVLSAELAVNRTSP